MEQHSFFELITSHWKSNKAFVVYKKPNSQELKAQLQNNNDFETLDFNESGFLFAPFNNQTDKKIWFSTKKSKVITTTLSNFEIVASDQIQNGFNTFDRDNHIFLIKNSLIPLKDGTLQKVVLSRKESIALKTIDPFVYFKKACELYKNTFCYCWFHPKVGMWLGATPETLLNLNKNKFETMALAGTMPYKGTEDVEWGAKEVEEQQIVVDSIINELTPIVDFVETGKTKTQKAGSLLHLKTPIKGILHSNKGLQKLVDLLHPTSAVCGLPKKIAKDYILGNENYDRKYYTGYLGEINPMGASNLFVNLRCMEIEKLHLSIYVGGGITALSNADKEWQETVNKSQIMKGIL